MEQCPLCAGEKRPGLTTHTVDLGFGLVVVRNVPASICSQCGEEWIGAGTARELEKIVEESKEKKRQFEVIAFQQTA